MLCNNMLLLLRPFLSKWLSDPYEKECLPLTSSEQASCKCKG